MVYKSLVLVLFFLNSITCFAFNSSKCKYSYWNTKGKGFYTSVSYRLLNFTTSSGQFISSTGNCSAVASAEQKRKQYYLANANFIRSDIVKGTGENISGLIALYDCNKARQSDLIIPLKTRYTEIFNDDNASFTKLDLALKENCHRFLRPQI